MNLFSSEAFLRTLGRVRFPGKECSLGLYQVEGQLFRLLEVEGRPVLSADFLDFFQPLTPPFPGPIKPLDYLPKAVLETTLAGQWKPSPARLPSPYLDWSGFPDWAAFEASVAARIGNLLPDSSRRRKKLVRDLGPLRFELENPRPEVFERCLRWKSAQYLATHGIDLFADPDNLKLFRELVEQKVVVVSSLTAGDTLLAAHLAGLVDERLYWWVPAYDPELARYSPGRLLLLESLKESHARGHREFDFLIGDEGYKWHFATHNRAIGALGSAPLALRVGQEAKVRIKSALARYPAALEAARAVRRRLRGS